MHIQERTSRIKRRLLKDGWCLERHGSNHDTHRPSTISGIVTLPRHPTVSAGVVISIAEKAGWTDWEDCSACTDIPH